MLPNDTRRRPKGTRSLEWVVALVVVLAMAVVAAAAMRAPSAERRALLRMAPDERRVLYERSMENLRALCGQGPRTDALERQCAAQTRFVVEFPECEDECRAIARLHQPRPVK